uniref:Prophenoloxidase 2-2 n=1 Tax=Sogatella furcifera TaxID=113103 RepID=A0A7M1I606_SOGFU|nr:prophenoloxidase 2-2 [Sogatella furcifera]
MDLKEILLALFDRPNEPLFLPKGDEQFTFHMPEDYLEDRFKIKNISDRFGGDNVVDLKRITLPDLDLPLQLKKTEQFTPFIPLHRQMAGQLIEKFLEIKNLEDFVSCSAYCRQNMNPLLFNYAYSVALLHRNDTKGFDLPPLHEFFPDKFIDYGIFSKARMEANISSTVEDIQTEPIEVPLDYTASDLDHEHRVAYFREDVGINLHHWHWHLVYPFLGPRRVVAKDRRGEIFYFMHQQIIARYNFERLCNKLARVKKLIDLRSPIPEAYFPKLDSLTASRTWAARSPNSMLQDINRETEQLVFDIQDLERWRDRLYEAVSTGRVINTQGQSVPLSENTGIDILGDLIEASSLSINRNFYGDLHNLGHAALSLIHDPEFKYLENVSVVGDLATAMRDPVFYRWHALIDDIFVKYKQTLPPYSVQQLGFDGIRINSIEVNSKSSPKNQFSTFWQQSDVNLARGMDFAPRSNVFARITHLQHQPFEYKIKVTNTGQQRQGTVRIFLAPKFDERGLPFLFNDERKMMIEVDRFVHNFKQQSDTITRKSQSSSLIIPFERTFRDLKDTAAFPGGMDAFNFCGCGWPEHMMIPRGTPEGFPATLFVMVSDYQFDKVDDPKAAKKPSSAGCEPASIYCGIRDQKYPDARPMGYPFDRVGRAGVNTLREFLTPNMLTQDVIIKFSNVIVPPGSVSRA